MAAAEMVVLRFSRPANDAPRQRHATTPEIMRELNRGDRDRHGPLTALDCVLDTLTSRGLIDPSKVGLSGLSDGADTVAYVLPRSPRYAAAAVSGLFTAVGYFTMTNSGVQHSMKTRHSVDSVRAAYELERPRALPFLVDKVTTPLRRAASPASAQSC